MLGNTVIFVIYFAALLSAVKGNCRNCINCDGNSECLGGCKPGFAGHKCDHECSCHCVDSLCYHDASTGTFPCSIGCTPGYYGLHCNSPCNSTTTDGMCDRFSGTSPDCQNRGYGTNCTTPCRNKCNGSVCDNKGKCFQEVCIPGRYGADCNKHCEAKCEFCHKDTGKCLKQNERIDVPYNSSCSCDKSDGEQVECDNGYFIATIFLIVLMVIGSAVLAILCIYSRILCCKRVNTDHEVDGMCESDQAKLEYERLIREERESVEESKRDADKLREEVEELQSSEKKLFKEKEEAERKTEQLKKELQNLKACQNKIVIQEHNVERCSNIQFSRTKCNTEFVHINAIGELITKPHTDTPHSKQRLKKYYGTSSIFPLPQCGSPQYFEMKSRVHIDEPLTKNILLLEIGLAREEEQDQSHCMFGLSTSYSLTVAHCSTHNSVCRFVWRNGTYVTCLPETLKNTPGTTTLHYGVVYDNARSRIAFLDVMDKRIIGKIDNVDSSFALWPMFGVYKPQNGTIGMSLIVGSDINITDNKKALILDCLS